MASKKAILIYLNNYIPTKIMSYLMEHYQIDNYIFIPKEIKNEIDDELSLSLNTYLEYTDDITNKMENITNKIFEFVKENLTEGTFIIIEKGPFFINNIIYQKIKEYTKKEDINNIKIIEDLN